MRNTKPGPGEMFLRGLAQPWPEDCIIWPFSKNTVSGYGQTVFQRRKMPSHRASAICHIGQQPAPRLEVAHSCKNRACCNPAHLSWKTRSENHADKWAHGTMRAGENHPSSKLTEANVRYARQMAGRTSHEMLAAMFGVSTSTVSLAIGGKTWAHLVTDPEEAS